MDDAPAPDAPKSAKDKLAELVAQRKRALATRGFKVGRPSAQAEDARSAAKSRPALRK